MIIIKCRYKYCKNNNTVNKEDAIKEGNSYYCKECYKEKKTKQQIENYYIENLPSTTIQVLRRVIKELIYNKSYEAEYVLFIVKKIHINKLKINNPFGLINYCNEGRNIDEWNNRKIINKYNNIKNDIAFKSENKEVKFEYITSRVKKWTDLI